MGSEDDAGLAGKVALVSGGGAVGDGIGNGRAAAILLARAGTKVLVTDRDLKLAERGFFTRMIRIVGNDFHPRRPRRAQHLEALERSPNHPHIVV